MVDGGELIPEMRGSILEGTMLFVEKMMWMGERVPSVTKDEERVLRGG